MSYTLIDLFSGAGGFTLGFTKAGFSPIFAVENDKDAAKSYRLNFGDHCLTEDIREIYDFPIADVLIGGPPCQGFSNLGTNIPDDPRNQLWRHFTRCLEISKPKVFILENVPPLLKSEEGKQLISAAKALGYEVDSKVLNSADYGSFQIRKRAIIIGSLIGKVIFPKQTHFDPEKVNGNHNIKKWKTVKDAIGNLPFEPTEENLHFSRNPTELSLERYEHVPYGGNRFDLPLYLQPKCWIKKKSGGTDLFGRLWWERPSVTIRTEFFKPEKGRYLHPEANRPITLREGARLQGFPDDFKFSGSRTSIAKQIGNAVPVELANAIADTVITILKNG